MFKIFEIFALTLHLSLFKNLCQAILATCKVKNLQTFTFDRNHEHYASGREEGRKGGGEVSPRRGGRKPKKQQNCDDMYVWSVPTLLPILLFKVEKVKVIKENI